MRSGLMMVMRTLMHTTTSTHIHLPPVRPLLSAALGTCRSQSTCPRTADRVEVPRVRHQQWPAPCHSEPSRIIAARTEWLGHPRPESRKAAADRAENLVNKHWTMKRRARRCARGNSALRGSARMRLPEGGLCMAICDAKDDFARSIVVDPAPVEARALPHQTQAPTFNRLHRGQHEERHTGKPTATSVG